MPIPISDSEHVSEVDTAILEADLFLKYKAPERAIQRLVTALEQHARSIPLRERIREVAITHKQPDEAARQCLALASLYIEREEFDDAYDRLLEAKQLDPRINIASGLDAIRRARRPDLVPHVPATKSHIEIRSTLSGDLSYISVFDAVQVLENAKLTGVLLLMSDAQEGRIFFNAGTIVDAEAGGESGEAGFRHIVEITDGSFDFQKSDQDYEVKIHAISNTNLLLDTVRMLDEQKQ
jgi:hypothetical protein